LLRRSARAVLAVALGALVLAGLGSAKTSSMMWGTTLDNTAGISRGDLDAQVSALASLPVRPTSRIVMDIGTTPADYAEAVPAIHKVSKIMAELGDSSEVKGLSTASYASFVQRLVDAYKGDVDIWEVGNEVNGEWVGTPTQEMARVQAAYDIVERAGGATALTLYYNPNCYEKRSNELFTWLADGNVPRAMAKGLDFVTISYYPSDCNGYWPTAAGWQSVYDRLHARFPHAKLAFGEAGQSENSLSDQKAVALLNKYASVRIAGNNYVGGYFWWYWAENAVRPGGEFLKGFAAAQLR
jgi:hypothetical protein